MIQPSPRQEMKAYDALPKALRQALSASGDQFSAAQLLEALRSRRFTCAELITMIEEQDQTGKVPQHSTQGDQARP